MPSPLDKVRNTKGQFQTKHGFSYTGKNHPVYMIWTAMRARCNNPKHHAFERYGGRGIRVCPEWDSFEVFWKDMGASWSEGLSIERLNNNGPYSKENCVWASSKEQANNRGNNRRITIDGTTKTVTQWAEQYGIPPHRIFQKLKRGLDIGEIFKTP